MDNYTKLKLIKLFIKKDVDLNQKNVIAALITAVSKMANLTDIISEEEVIEILINEFQLNQDSDITNLIGMPSNFIKYNIGYSIDVYDYDKSNVEYTANKAEYDELYSNLKDLKENRKR